MPFYPVCTYGAAVCFISCPLLANEDLVEQVPFGGVEHEHTHGPQLSIQPRATLRSVYGKTELEDAGLMQGGHDPVHNGLSVPDFSVGLDMNYGEHFAAFTEGALSWNEHDGWDNELEEAYVKFMNLPGGFQVHAGILLNMVGTQNHIHTHSWNFVDAQLGNVRFLGEDGLAIEGVEIHWTLPTRWDDRVVISFGNAIEHDHAHEDEDEEDHDDDDHDGEAEELLWDSNVFSARYEAILWPSDHRRYIYGLTYIQGTNFMGHRSQLYGFDFTYYYCSDETHAQQFTWRNEAMLRKVGTDDGQVEEFAFSSSAIYRTNPDWEVAFRYGYLEGIDAYDVPERHRISPSIARHFNWGDNTHSSVRLQYNYDHSKKRGDDHSIWLQFMIAWGGGDDHVH